MSLTFCGNSERKHKRRLGLCHKRRYRRQSVWLYVAREAFPKANVYYSESTHYSVKKNLHLLQLNNVVIRSQDNGEMDYDDLESVIAFHREKPAIFFLNIGTTMTEAVDKLDENKKNRQKIRNKQLLHSL